MFSGDGQKPAKILAGYHQYFAVKKAIERAKVAAETDGKGGVFWHTQGSGKSLSHGVLCPSAAKGAEQPDDCGDDRPHRHGRPDCICSLRGARPSCVRTRSRRKAKSHLKKLLEGRQANGIIFTTMSSLSGGEKPCLRRRNIVVMADEAHRGQYGFEEKVVMEENGQGEKEPAPWWGNARIIREALPNATYVGFTGTPISAKDRNTREVFGDYIDVLRYDPGCGGRRNPSGSIMRAGSSSCTWTKTPGPDRCYI